jgi:predicted chitinase
MDYATLCAVMGRTVPQSYLPGFNQALIAAQCTTVNRAAMFVAQTGHESGGLLWLEELASGAEYNGRADLGNTKPGWGVRYKGRGAIQLTGAFNYQAFSRWAYAQHMVSSPTYFFDNPTQVSVPPWAFISASYYWVVARTTLNAAADRGDVNTCTRLVNGGTNGLADRTARWKRALTYGARLLPTGGDDMAAVPQSEWNDVHAQEMRAEPPWAGGYTDEKNSAYDSFMYAKRANVEVHQCWLAIQALTAKVDALATKLEAKP